MTKKKPKEQKQTKTTKQLGVQVDVDQWRRFRTLAFQKGLTAASLLNEVLEDYLQKEGGG